MLAPGDAVMNNKKHTFGLHPVSGTELLKRLAFPKWDKGDKGVLIFVTNTFRPQLMIIRCCFLKPPKEEGWLPGDPNM